MTNTHVGQRLAGIQAALVAFHAAGASMTNATKGREREGFINEFLSAVFPSHFRFGSGEITDFEDRRSGQLDVVIEFPFLPSLPVTQSSPRLYLAEGVGAVIEVKSDLSQQWGEVVSTSSQLKPLARQFQTTVSIGEPPGPRIPLFAVGYKGWARMETLKEHVEQDVADGILVIENGLFASSKGFRSITASGPWALWGLVCCIQQAIGTLKDTGTDPLKYALA